MSKNQKQRLVSAGNGSCIAPMISSQYGHEAVLEVIAPMRSRYRSAVTMLRAPSSCNLRVERSDMYIGKGGQTLRISRASVLIVHESSTFKRRGDANTMFRNLRQTWTSLIQERSPRVPWFSSFKQSREIEYFQEVVVGEYVDHVCHLNETELVGGCCGRCAA